MATEQPTNKTPRAIADDTWARTEKAMASLLERITPWLLDLGNWIFGALIAFTLVILGALLTVGPVDHAVLVATAAFALALPPGVAGFLLLRLAADMKRVDVEQVATEAFVEAGFRVEDRSDPRESEKKLGRTVLLFSYVLMALTVVLTLVGVTAALWHMSWWIGLLFVAMAVLSVSMVMVVLASTGSRTTWRSSGGEVEPRK